MSRNVRLEKDFLGVKEIPSNVYYGIQTQRAMENFYASGIKADDAFIIAYARIKLAACMANYQLGLINKKKAKAIMQAANEIVKGKHKEHLVVDAYQAGGGTSFNMNMNEVIANRALELLGKKLGTYSYVHPNDHVNFGQSTNDTFPTALNLAALDRWLQLVTVLEDLVLALEQQGKKFKKIIKAGRTHLQDAVPMRLGEEFLAYASAIRRSIRIGKKVAEELYEVAIGGTAIGNKLNAADGYQKKVIRQLQLLTKLPIRANYNLFEAIQSQQSIAVMSSVLRNLALELTRIANDLRLLSSGPRTGLNEIKIPAIQPGSSIMPGKVNPSLLECLTMVCYQVIGNDSAIAFAVQAGQLELNVMIPLISHNILQSFRLLINSMPPFTNRCIAEITANEEQCRKYANQTQALGTLLSPMLGYAKTAELIKESQDENSSIRDLVVKKHILSKNKADKIFNLEIITDL